MTVNFRQSPAGSDPGSFRATNSTRICVGSSTDSDRQIPRRPHVTRVTDAHIGWCQTPVQSRARALEEFLRDAAVVHDKGCRHPTLPAVLLVVVDLDDFYESPVR